MHLTSPKEITGGRANTKLQSRGGARYELYMVSGNPARSFAWLYALLFSEKRVLGFCSQGSHVLRISIAS